MKKSKQMKISLKSAIIIGIIIILLISIIGIGVYSIYLTKSNDNAENVLEQKIGSNVENVPNQTKESDITENGFCRIKGKNSDLLYKNEQESDTSYSEKIIYLDEEAKNNMISSSTALDAYQVLRRGAFKGEFIRVKYDSDVSDYESELAFIADKKFYKCTTNKLVTKAFDKNENEKSMPNIDFKTYERSMLDDIPNIYALFDITTQDNEDYIVGMYGKIFMDDNPNTLVITVVLKKQNYNIDIDDEAQVKNFWNKYANYEIEKTVQSNQQDYEIVDVNGKTYYHRLTTNKWNGEYHQDTYYTSHENSKMEVVSYEDYIKYINEINSNASEEIESYYTDKNSNYIILSYANGSSWCDMELINYKEENNQIIIYGDENVRGVMADGSGYFVTIPTKMPIGTTIQYIECYSTSEISNLKNYKTPQTEVSIDKPIIYLYPTEDTEVSLKLLKDKNLTCSYPKYKDEWKVLAKANGDLKDLKTNRQLYSLYYESKSDIKFGVENEGFVVKGEDTISFLEEKLDILGLTEREAEEFIVYWLPKLEANKYNYIRFATIDEINENMPLEISPNPDTLIRVLMTFKGLESPIDVQKQKLKTPNRTGFVAVEWGGTEIK